MRRRVTVVGAGNVGATCAHRIAERDYADVVLVDTEPGRAARVGLDLNIAAATNGYAPTVLGTEGFAEMSGSSVVVLTAAADGVQQQTADRELIATVAAE